MFRQPSIVACLFLCSFLGPALGQARSADPSGSRARGGGSVLIVGAKVFDGRRILGRRDVLIVDGTIRQISAHIDRVAGISLVDGTGRTLLPGLIDAHVHTIPGGAADALRFGVTSEFDLYSFGNRDEAAARRQHRQSFARTAEADLWSSGFGITPPGGHPSELFNGQEGVPPIPVLGPRDDPKKFVAARIADGADYLKVIEDDGARVGFPASLPAFSLPRFAQVMRAAKASKLRVIVHVQQLEYAKVAVRGDADALAHSLADYPADRELLDAMRRKNVALIGTLAIYDGIGGGGGAARLLADPLIAPYLSPMQKMLLGLGIRTDPREEVVAIETVRRAHRAGITILAGTDAPNPTTGFGVSLLLELQMLVKAGLRPDQALTAATAAPARFYGANDRGRIAAGLRGDLVLVDGDPTKNIADVRRIVAIYKNGWPVDRTVPASLK